MTLARVTFATPLVVELAEGDAPPPRTITGTALPFGVESGPDSISRARYRFEGPPSNPEDLVDVVRGHDADDVVGRLAVPFDVRDEGLGAVARAFGTRGGDDVLELAREHVLTGFSVQASIEDFDEVDGVRVVAAGAYSIDHLGVVRRPAFEGAVGLTVAAASIGDPAVTVTTDPPVVELPTIAELAAAVAPLIAELAADPGGVHPLSRFARESDYVAALAAADGDEARELQAAFAAADQVTTANPGVIPPGWRTEIKAHVDARRPAITGTGGPIGLPPAGMDASWPYLDPALDIDGIIAQQLAEKAELTGVPIKILKATEPILTAGTVSDISYQLLMRSSPSYLEAYLRICRAAWARYTEAVFESELEAVATEIGGTPPTTLEGWAAWLFTASSAVEDATGAPATVVGVASDVWLDLGGLPGIVNPNYGTNNQQGTASASSLRVNINGLEVTRWPFLSPGAAVVTNGEAARFPESGPLVAAAEDVVKLGRNVAVWGMYEAAEIYFPAGVVKVGDGIPLSASSSSSKGK